MQQRCCLPNPGAHAHTYAYGSPAHPHDGHHRHRGAYGNALPQRVPGHRAAAGAARGSPTRRRR